MEKKIERLSRFAVTIPGLKVFAWGLVVAWTLLIGAILLLDIQRGRLATQAMAVSEARAHFNKDVAFRLWGTEHGLVYVPISEKNGPDPHLADMPERDIQTPSGQRLTLMNPARMIRQLNEWYGTLYGVTGHITSLKPLRPENAPDAWEQQAIQRFDQDIPEVMEFTEMAGEPYLRLMRPLKIEAGCLNCHARQGFEVGDISGGVGVALPLKGLLAQERKRLLFDGLSLGVVWLLGVFPLFFGYRRVVQGEQKRTETMAELLQSEVRKSAIMNSSLDCIVTMDHRGDITEFNPAAEKAFGYRREEVMGRNLADMLVPPSLRGLHSEGLKRHLAGGPKRLLGTRMETTAMRSDGEEFPVELTVTRIDLQGQPLFTAYIRDRTEALRLEEQILFQSTHDDLTGLVNRAEFERRLSRLLDDLVLGDTQHAVFALDLDQFKIINDTCGHAAGDELLRQVGKLLYSRTRAGDTLARIGGDEFGLLLEHCPLDKAETIGRELLKAVEAYRFVWEGHNFNVTVSVGLAPIHIRGQSLSDVLSTVDTACHVAKEQGRNRLHLFRHDDVELARRQGEMRWVSRIHDAFENGRFFLYYQSLLPLTDGVTDNRWHYEILIRMRDEQGEFVAPAVFLSAAERYGLMPTIDRWVVRSTFAWLESQPQHLNELGLCSINLSGHSVTDDAFLLFLEKQLTRKSIPAERICFEITETAAVSNLAKAERFIQTIRQRGCRFALDDFGSGMSSFNYLKNLPVDFLKIDGVFVRDIMEDEIDFAMVRSINDIGHVMGKITIAEFVENEAILERLREIGVDYAQGYGVARPAPLEWLSGEESRVLRPTA